MNDNDTTEGSDSEYGRRVGERLRAIRRQKRLSLQDVESESSQEFKASVLGAYERGERAISVPRLQRLAEFYQVPVDQLLPRATKVGIKPSVLDLTEKTGRAGVTIDLTHLHELAGPEGDMLSRYLGMIQVQRQDFNGCSPSVKTTYAPSPASLVSRSTMPSIGSSISGSHRFLPSRAQPIRPAPALAPLCSLLRSTIPSRLLPEPSIPRFPQPLS